MEYTHGHGPLKLKTALETSCNIFFYDIGVQTGIDNLNKWSRYFGLGEKTGIDLRNERAGVLASKEYKKKTFNDIWRPADTAQSAIGQLYNNFTPLQMTNYMSTLANGGKKNTPHLIKRISHWDGKTVKENNPEPEIIPISPETIKAVKEGMVAVTTSIDGTAAKIFKDYPYTVAGKTGTAETGQESKHS